MPPYHACVTPNVPEFSTTGQDQNGHNRTVSGLLQIFGASFSVLDPHWSLGKCVQGNYIESGWCPAIPPGQNDIPSLLDGVFNKSAMWLRLKFYPTVVGGTHIDTLHLDFKFNIVGTTYYELYVGTQRVVPPGTVQKQTGSYIQGIDLVNISATQVLAGCNYLDILIRVCSQANPVQGTFNFQEVSGDIII